jgi:mannose-6-phosphate isomerase-like protein (cupin superfamily)
MFTGRFMTTKQPPARDRQDDPDGRIVRFGEQSLQPHVAHDGVGHVLARRARKHGDGVNCNFIDCVVVPAGATIGVHTHALDNEEIYVVLAGHGVMTIEHEERAVGPGDVNINPPGGTHGLRNTGAADLRLVVIEYPVG